MSLYFDLIKPLMAGLDLAIELPCQLSQLNLPLNLQLGPGNLLLVFRVRKKGSWAQSGNTDPVFQDVGMETSSVQMGLGWLPR